VGTEALAPVEVRTEAKQSSMLTNGVGTAMSTISMCSFGPVATIFLFVLAIMLKSCLLPASARSINVRSSPWFPPRLVESIDSMLDLGISLSS